MTRKYGDDLYRSPSTMTSGHLSSLSDGASNVGVPDLKRLGQEAGFHPVPRKKEGGADAKSMAGSKSNAQADHLSVASSKDRAGSDPTKSSTGKGKERQNPIERTLQLLNPHKNKQKGDR